MATKTAIASANMLHKIHIDSGKEVIQTIKEYCKKNNIKNAAIVSLIGALDKGRVMSSSKSDAMENIYANFEESLELSGTGEIVDGTPHIHCILGRVDGKIIMGHLEQGFVKAWFVNAYLLPLKKHK